MTRDELQTYLHDHIPLSKAMQVSVVSIAADRLVLKAPLAPNINHRETVFGGSASALAILSAWSLLHTRLQAEGLEVRLVIMGNSMTYDRPIVGEFTATASLTDDAVWQRFVTMFRRRGKARISVSSYLEYVGEVTGRFEGEFVALPLADTVPA